MGKCCRAVVPECCREVLRSSVAQECCEGGLWSVVEKCCREVLRRSAVAKCCGEVV